MSGSLPSTLPTDQDLISTSDQYPKIVNIPEPDSISHVTEHAIDNEEEPNTDYPKRRFFKLCAIDENGQEHTTGRFVGLKPKQAANKAFAMLCQQKNIGEENTIFNIKECTRGAKQKMYTFEGRREKLTKPQKITIKNPDGSSRDICYTFANRITKHIPEHQPYTLGNGKPRRIYIDGIFDLFHRGHVECLRKAKEFLNGPVELIVGVISDADATSYKRPPIYNEEDRYVIIRSICYVDEVIMGAPLIMTKEFVDRHRIDCIVHGFSDPKDFDKQKEFFKEVSDIFYQIPYYKHLSTTEILNKIRQNRSDK